ncbi:hypothetical protein ABZY19_15540 [Streptomyces sp. NPDC006475]|uniref:hypothetical protein n=1 Tax=Streptomyces sp. NPDC006475 TaxID=3155719 RepID=UPI0033A07749
MYAIKVILQPEESAQSSGRQPCDGAADRIGRNPQPGIEHVSLVPRPPHIVAMTFVAAGDLRAAEQLALSAWTFWLTETRFAHWRLICCAADLPLGVWAAEELLAVDGSVPETGR